MKYVYITSEEAKKMALALEYIEQNTSDKDLIAKCKLFKYNIKDVRPDVDYSPFRGYQIPIKNSDEHFFTEVWTMVEQALQLKEGK